MGRPDNDDKIYRQRYLDLIVNQESRERFRQRAKIIQEMRKYLRSVTLPKLKRLCQPSQVEPLRANFRHAL